MKKRTLKIIGIILFVLIGAIFTFAKTKRVTPLSWNHKMINTSVFSSEAINGFDAVSYFKSNKAVKGNASYFYTWNDAKWYFTSEENKKQFITNPEKYLPQYGGFCSFAVSKGFTANSNPNVYKIMNNNIYFFADENVKTEWLNNKEENVKLSNANWKK